MPNIKSAKKRVLVARTKSARNQSQKSTLKTNLKKFDVAVKLGDKSVAQEAYKVAVKSVDKACAKNLIHKNNAAHKKSTLTIAYNAMA